MFQLDVVQVPGHHDTIEVSYATTIQEALEAAGFDDVTQWHVAAGGRPWNASQFDTTMGNVFGEGVTGTERMIVSKNVKGN